MIPVHPLRVGAGTPEAQCFFLWMHLEMMLAMWTVDRVGVFKESEGDDKWRWRGDIIVSHQLPSAAVLEQSTQLH